LYLFHSPSSTKSSYGAIQPHLINLFQQVWVLLRRRIHSVALTAFMILIWLAEILYAREEHPTFRMTSETTAARTQDKYGGRTNCLI
jgi:hypothetical protein